MTFLLFAGQALASQESELTSRFEAAQFQCTHLAAGTQCVGRLSPYPEPVAVIIPRGFDFQGRILVHLHGYVLGGANDKTFGAILNDFSFTTLLARAKETGALLLVPASRGHCETYLNYFSGRDSFNLLLEALEEVSGLSSLNPTITLSGHSGAYQPISQILGQAVGLRPGAFVGAIDQIFLLDATYSSIDTAVFKGWLRADAKHTLRAVFRAGTGTEKGSRKLWIALSANAFSVAQPNTLAAHQGVILPAASSGDAADHWGTVRVYLPQFLSKTALSVP